MDRPRQDFSISSEGRGANEAGFPCENPRPRAPIAQVVDLLGRLATDRDAYRAADRPDGWGPPAPNSPPPAWTLAALVWWRSAPARFFSPRLPTQPAAATRPVESSSRELWIGPSPGPLWSAAHSVARLLTLSPRRNAWIARSSMPPERPGHEAGDCDKHRRQKSRTAQESLHDGEGMVGLLHWKVFSAVEPRLEMSST